MKYTYGKKLRGFRQTVTSGVAGLVLLFNSLSVALPFMLAQNASAAPVTVNTEAELTSALTDNSVELITFGQNITTTAQVTVNRPVTIAGDGFTLSPAYTYTDNGNNSGIGIIGTSNVTVNDLTIDGAGGTNLHGINAFESTNVALNSVTSRNNDKSGVSVNGSSVTVNDISTSGNGWHGLNADKDMATLTVNGTSTHNEVFADIYVDNDTLDVAVNDTNSQYDYAPSGIPGRPNDRVYRLKPSVTACNGSTFDNFTVGSVNGQNGWTSTGPFDQEIVDNTYGYADFGCKSLRKSNAVTSGSFGNQTFSYSTTSEAGEADAEDSPLSGGTRQNHFEAEFDIASTSAAHQPSLALSVSPDRGDGARMSYLRFEDQSDGIHVFFDDVTSTTDPAVWNEIDIATLSRTTPHTVKFVIDFHDGPSNDVVKIYINDTLEITGTTWENYYRFDNESNPDLSVESRTVDSLIFLARSAAAPDTSGNGFLFDNMSIYTSTLTVDPDPTDSHVLRLSGDVYRDIALDNCDNLNECKDQRTNEMLEGWEMHLYKEDTAGAWQQIGSDTTDVNGAYGFAAQQDAGIYHICEVVKTGWTQPIQTWSGSGYKVDTANLSGNTAEGPYCTTSNYTDTGDKSSKSHFGNVDTTKPHTAVLSPATSGGSYNTDFDIEIQSTDGQTGIVKAVANLYSGTPTGTLLRSCVNETVSPATTPYDFTCHIDVSDLGDGDYYIKTNALDAGGNLSNTVTWIFHIDTTPPDVPVLLSPGNGVPVNGSSPIANDWQDVAGAAFYTYQSYNVDGSGNCNLSSIRWTEDYTASQTNSRVLTDGLKFCWRVKAVDHVGNPSGWSDIWKTIADNTAPLADITSHGNGDTLSGIINLIGEVTDDNPMNSYFRIEKADGAFVTDSLFTNGRTTHELSWDTTTVSDGDYKVFFETRDKAGNKDGSRPAPDDSVAVITITVDNTAPLLSLNSIPTNSSSSRTISGTSEPGALIEVEVNSTPQFGSTVADASGNWSLVFNGLAVGTHSVAATSTDSAGNTQTENSSFEVIEDEGVVESANTSTPSSPANNFTAGSNNGTLNNGEVLAQATGDEITQETDADNQVQTQEDGAEVLATGDEDQNNDTGGLAWYWWVLIVLAILTVLWLLFGRRRSEES